jgi:hypothetical protein
MFAEALSLPRARFGLHTRTRYADRINLYTRERTRPSVDRGLMCQRDQQNTVLICSRWEPGRMFDAASGSDHRALPTEPTSKALPANRGRSDTAGGARRHREGEATAVRHHAPVRNGSAKTNRCSRFSAISRQRTSAGRVLRGPPGAHHFQSSAGAPRTSPQGRSQLVRARRSSNSGRSSDSFSSVRPFTDPPGAPPLFVLRLRLARTNTSLP